MSPLIKIHAHGWYNGSFYMPNALLAAQSLVPKHLVNQLINNNYNTISHCEKRGTTYSSLARSDRLDMF